MPSRDNEDPDPSVSISFSDLVAPGRPVTFVAAGCQIVVARDARTFDITLVGTLNRANRRRVGEVLEAIVTIADATRLSLRRLTELDDAGAVLLNDIANIASRSNVTWLVVDGGLSWQAARDRLTSSAQVAAPLTAVRPTQIVAPRLRRTRRRIVPSR